MLNIAVVDDENLFRNVVEDYLKRAQKEIAEEYQVYLFDNAFDFMESRVYFDVIFFDIAMPMMTGYEAAQKIRERGDTSIIVFLTSLAQYAIKGYEVEAFDFIVKPVKYHDFLYRLKKAVAKAAKEEANQLLIKYNGNLKKLPLEDILFIESIDHMAVIHTVLGNYETRESVKALESRLGAGLFEKCNYSFLVNLKRIDHIEGDAIHIKGNTLYFSRNRKKAFLEKYCEVGANR